MYAVLNWAGPAYYSELTTLLSSASVLADCVRMALAGDAEADIDRISSRRLCRYASAGGMGMGSTAR